MAGIFEQAVGTERKIAEEEDKAKSEAGQKQLKTEEKVYDVKKEYEEEAEAGLKEKGWWQKGLSMAAMIGGTMMGLGPVMMGLMSTAGTLAGGKIGHEKLKSRLAGTEAGSKGWLQKSRQKLSQGSVRETLMSSLIAGVSGAALGKGAEAAGGASGGAGHFGEAAAEGGYQNIFTQGGGWKQMWQNLKTTGSSLMAGGGEGASNLLGNVMGGGTKTLMQIINPDD